MVGQRHDRGALGSLPAKSVLSGSIAHLNGTVHMEVDREGGLSGVAGAGI